MIIEKKVKITLASVYLLLIIAFLWFLFTNFSINDFTSYEIIKSNRDTLNNLKNINIFFSVSVFLLISIIWVLLLGFGSLFLIGGLFWKMGWNNCSFNRITTGSTYYTFLLNF